MAQGISFDIGATSFGLFGRKDAISCRRPDYSIEDVKEDGRENDRQDNIHDSSPKIYLPRKDPASLLQQQPRGLISLGFLDPETGR
jgi:hypothetical protein